MKESVPAPSREPPLLDAKAVADILSVHVNTLRRYVRDGLLRPVRVRRQGPLRFRRAEIAAFLGGAVMRATDRRGAANG